VYYWDNVKKLFCHALKAMLLTNPQIGNGFGQRISIKMQMGRINPFGWKWQRNIKATTARGAECWLVVSERTRGVGEMLFLGAFVQ
jgi:hypothetical protein